MPTFNSFDSALNLTKCFKKTPPLTFKIENLPKLPINWLTLLEKQCSEINPNSPKNIFFKHIGVNSSYKSKTLLKEQLSVLYHRISGNLDTQLGCLDSQASQLLIRLIEDINNCIEGFHIRVNSLVNSLHTPKGLDQLLYLVRKGIVQEIASGLINQDKALYQVHVADRVIRIAEKLDLGLTSQIKKDRYKGSLLGKNIRQVLETDLEGSFFGFLFPSPLCSTSGIFQHHI